MNINCKYTDSISSENLTLLLAKVSILIYLVVQLSFQGFFYNKRNCWGES
jgi:hypothetical protein